MAKRCTNTNDLEVHHKNVVSGNDLSNAQVLCRECHKETTSFCNPSHKSPPAFSDDTKEKAKRKAGHQCECTRETCSHNRKNESVGFISYIDDILKSNK